MLQEQLALTRAVLKDARQIRGVADAERVVADWTDAHQGKAGAVRATIQAIEAAAEPWTFAKLTIVNAELRELATLSR
jgi:glutamate dehydrogenase